MKNLEDYIKVRREEWPYEERYKMEKFKENGFAAKVDDNLAAVAWSEDIAPREAMMHMTLKSMYKEYGIGTEVLVTLIEHLKDKGYNKIYYNLEPKFYAFQIYKFMGLKKYYEDEDIIKFVWKPSKIWLAGGCFWGTEHFMKQIDGVLDTKVGYANSNIDNPSYEEVCSEETGAAETVEVKYDEGKAPLEYLLNLYFMTIDPLSLNKQGGDEGLQYRTGIYYEEEEDYAKINAALNTLQERIGQKPVIEVKKLENFYFAENYHQDYLIKNPKGYCHVNSSLFEIAKNSRYEK